jgi:hypothetical protein
MLRHSMSRSFGTTARARLTQGPQSHDSVGFSGMRGAGETARLQGPRAMFNCRSSSPGARSGGLERGQTAELLPGSARAPGAVGPGMQPKPPRLGELRSTGRCREGRVSVPESRCERKVLHVHTVAGRLPRPICCPPVAASKDLACLKTSGRPRCPMGLGNRCF